MTTTLYKAIAIDGGGTQCRLALVSDAGYESVVTGCANASSDLEGTVQSILSGVELLASQVSESKQSLIDLPVYIGAAGVVDLSIAEQLRMALPFTKIKIEDDRPSALCGALGGEDGFIAHCGTGSFFAVQENGVQQFVGGWGPRLDDVAAAYWVGMRALSITLYAFDGLEEQSIMTQAILKEYGGTGAIVAFAGEASPTEIARLAQQVTHYAKQDDSNAKKILKNGAMLIREKLIQLGWSTGKTICLTGGIANEYKHCLPILMRADVIGAKGEPLDGAVTLARRFMRELKT